MAGVDPISLAVIGAATGAVASPRDPLKGALMGGALGFGGGSLLAAPTVGAAAIPTATGTAAQSLIPATSANAGLKSVLMAEGVIPAASQAAATPFTSALAGSAGGITANQALNMGMRGMNLLSQQQPPTPTPSMYRGAKQVTTTEPIASLFDVNERKRKPVMSLL
jgi:hypothetical protein